jgi:hypothetical protein
VDYYQYILILWQINGMNKKLFIPRVIFAGFIIVGINSIIKGISQNEIWRVILASVAVAVFAFLLVVTFIKQKAVTSK